MAMEKIYIHLISDSTGETLKYMSRAVLSQFDEVESRDYIWPLIRNASQLEKAFEVIKEKRGIVLHTISDENLILMLKGFCDEQGLLCVDVLEDVTKKVASHLHQTPNPKPGKQHSLDYEYFQRIEAINFTILHDDGQSIDSVGGADIVLVGPSRTSKSPTSMYLAHRGFKTANIPYVKGIPFPTDLSKYKNVFVVGFYIGMDRLLEIRKNRLLTITESGKKYSYIDSAEVASEIKEAKQFYLKNGWPVIDVTNRSIEETTAKIINLYHEWKKNK